MKYIMKIKLYYLILLASLIVFSSCEKDNYEAPETFLKGRVVYQGKPIMVEWNQVTFQLWEEGREAVTPIDVPIAQDGTFSALLFNGTYELVFPAGQGPFEMVGGPILVELNGSKTLDIEVMPYYIVEDVTFSVDNREITASVDLEQIITGDDARDIERVNLYVSKTVFVQNSTSVATAELAGEDITDLNNISLSTTVPTLVPAQSYVFARVGVKIDGVEDMLYSDIVRIEL